MTCTGEAMEDQILIEQSAVGARQLYANASHDLQAIGIIVAGNVMKMAKQGTGDPISTTDAVLVMVLALGYMSLALVDPVAWEGIIRDIKLRPKGPGTKGTT